MPLRTAHEPTPLAPTPQPLWYKDAVIYELHVRAFYDSNADGIGDFPGITQKLDYLQRLGVTALWLLPFYPSPLKDDGYDIADYEDVHPDYGSLADFKTFLREAHRRDLRVITELVLNHTSDQHAWFQRARRASPDSPHRAFYVWSDTPERYKEARIIFKDFEASNWSWDPVAKAYYWHRFYSHQPDLNFDNPAVRRAILRVLDFWLGLGVDGLRLDAVPYLFEREGTNCENLPETHAFLRELRGHVDERFPHRMLLAEANQWPEDAAAYFGQAPGDECHTAFHFPLMPRLFMAIRTEDRFPIVDILQQTPPIPEGAQWILFLRNHDELTLEMVTDEERDYMYRVYATDPRARINLGIRRRLAPLLGNDRRRMELMYGLLFSFPGTPVIYYGDELGMGDNIYLGDRNGVRTPMQWSADRNAGFSRASPQRLYLPVIVDPEYHHEALNVEVQEANPNSFLWLMQRAILLRRRLRALGRGSIEFLRPENRKILAFIRRHGEERVLVVANLSRFAQFVELDLAPFRDIRPVELFGRTEFPPIGGSPYVLTLGPHQIYWLSLARAAPEIPQLSAPAPVLLGTDGFESLESREARVALNEVLPSILRPRRWFRGKARRIKATEIVDEIPLEAADLQANLLFVDVEYTEGESERYALPVAFASGPLEEKVRKRAPQAVYAQVGGGNGKAGGILYDALAEPAIARQLFDLIARRRKIRGRVGELAATSARALHMSGPAPEPGPVATEQTNTSVVYGDRFILKLFRMVESGPNPELEIGRFLTEVVPCPYVPSIAGSLQYQREREPRTTVAVLEQFLPNEGDAWKYSLDHLGRYFERCLARPPDLAAIGPLRPPLELAEAEPPEAIRDLLGTFLEAARLLGQRTAELHLALATDTGDPEFAPEPFTMNYQRSLYQSVRARASECLELLRSRLALLPPADRPVAERVLQLENRIDARYKVLLGKKIEAQRIRIHGDFHLGQVLFTGKDFAFIDFEGEPARPLSERRLKRSCLRDVAGMVRSFQYAGRSAVEATAGALPAGRRDLIEACSGLWTSWVSAAFLRAYLASVRGSRLVPSDAKDLEALLDVHVLSKALYEVVYELNNRPTWVGVPLRSLLQSLEESP